MGRKNTINIIILLVIYLVIISFPSYLFTSDLTVLYGVELGLRAAYLVFIIVFSLLTRMLKAYTGRTRFSNVFLLLPLFFVAFFNVFYLAVITKSSIPGPLDAVFNSNGNNTQDILKFLSIIVMVVEEELLFRFIIQRNIRFGHKIVRILITSALYAVAFFSAMLYDARGVIDPIDLINIIFVFGIGIILGFLYEYTNNIVVPITFSLIYTICNEMLYKISLRTANYKFYLTVTFFALGAALYLVVFYFLMLKRENR